ncbi:MAG: NtaA/DmoA family FMN-dependent monooxygenase [Hyphomicrobiaceae bacterium]
MSKRKMHLVGYLKTGPTALRSAGWRHPETPLDFFEPSWYEHAAQMMEAAKLDAVMLADFFGIPDTYNNSFETFVKVGGQVSYLDPTMVLPIMARVTSRIGLATTVSTSFYNAFHLARVLQSIDVLSKGRVAWNVITSSSNTEARNAGFDEMPPHDERYDRAEEVVEACMALWNTWDEGAFVLDKKAGLFADPSKVHYANYAGKWTKTRGPLPTPRSAQGHPVIMQAGSSDRGRDFAARWAEIIFIGGQEKHVTQEVYADLKKRIAAQGRDPDRVPIIASVTPTVGETESIARERAAYFESLENPEYRLALGSVAAGADLKKHKTVEEVAKVRGTQGSHGIHNRDAKTVDEMTRRVRPDFVGTPETVADKLQDYFESRACDGFVILPVSMMLSLEQFCRAVVPELQRRGLFRTEYAAATLRGNLTA